MKNAFLEKKSKQKGFTLIEVMITIVIVSIGMLALAGLLITGIKVNANSESRMDASGIAQSIVSRLSEKAAKTQNYTQNAALADVKLILGNRWVGSVTPSGVLYTPTVVMNPTTTGTTAGTFVAIIVKLQWTNRGQTKQVELRSGAVTN